MDSVVHGGDGDCHEWGFVVVGISGAYGCFDVLPYNGFIVLCFVDEKGCGDGA